MGLEFTRISAVDARDLSDEVYAQVQDRNIWTQDLTHGEVACFLSHGRALKQFIADNTPYGVIFEDDVALGRGAEIVLKNRNWLANMSDKAGEVIDLVKLETAGKKLWLGSPLPFNDERLKSFTLARIKSTHILAAAYLISRPAAIRLLDMMQRKAAPFDHFLFNFGLGNVQEFTLYQLDPAIAIQAGLSSTLEGERGVQKQKLKARRRVSQTLSREIIRLKKRAMTGLWGIKTNLFTRERWKRVPFNK